MSILELNIKGYRSIYDISLRLKRINVLIGSNGCGKSNLYNSVFIIAKAAEGQLAHTLANEGGMPSALWAGERTKTTQTKKPVRMDFSVKTDNFSYELSCGLPPGIPPSSFDLDPEIKEEYVWYGDAKRKSNIFLERKAGSTWIKNEEGKTITYPLSLSQSESVLSQLHEPHLYPELSSLREEMKRWRFYHYFRTDSDSPLRYPQIGVRTPILSNDGSDIAAAIQTIIEIGDIDALSEAIDEAFPESSISIQVDRGKFEMLFNMPGIKRPFEARELSDGTLRYIALVVALLSPRPPELLALNEPETSLHPDLMKPLAKLITYAGTDSQLWITTHSKLLSQYICDYSDEEPIELVISQGKTTIKDNSSLW